MPPMLAICAASPRAIRNRRWSGWLEARCPGCRPRLNRNRPGSAPPLVDLNPAPLLLLDRAGRLRQRDRQNAVPELRRDVSRINLVGDSQRAPKGAIGALRAVHRAAFRLLLLIELRVLLTLDRE